MSCRAWDMFVRRPVLATSTLSRNGRRHRRPFTVMTVLAGAAAMLALATACSSASGTTASSTASSAAALAPFKSALEVYYQGTSVQPPATAPTPKKNVSAWIISCGQASPGCSDVVAGASQAAGVLGWKVHVFDGQFGAGGAYDSGVRQAISAHAGVILVVGIDCNQAQPAFQAAKAANIPVVGINSYDCNDPAIHSGPALFSANVEYQSRAPSSATYFEAIGKAQADWLIVNSGGSAKVIDFTIQGVTGLEKTEQGFNEELAKCSGCKVIQTIAVSPPDLDNGTVKTVFSSALAKSPDVTAIWTADDTLIDAADIPQALAATGRLKSVKVIGVQGWAQNLNLIRNNAGQSVAVAYDPAWHGWAGVDEAVRVLDGQSPVPEGIGFQVIDATHNLPPTGQSYTDKIGFRAAYEKAWGLG